MNVKKLVGVLLLVLVIFFIVTNPGGASSTVSGIGSWLAGVGNSIITFFQGVTPG
ncbi:hypothetical protein [Pseudonocardia pini]|uniref:hypothetical protein n=1 Tax=Pseudonocardia pini TaxID=2758030 RepID=UPI0015F10D39|nr:hypothetical protein [Pseudonocardia pini]